MSLLQLGDPHDADERLVVIGRTLGIRETLRLLWERKSVRAKLVATIVMLPLGALLIAAAIDPTTTFVTVGERLIVAALGFVPIAVGLDALDQLACLVTSSHDCRHCRSETERWSAESDA